MIISSRKKKVKLAFVRNDKMVFGRQKRKEQLTHVNKFNENLYTLS